MLTDQTIIRYVSPDGYHVPLSGGLVAGRDGIWLGNEPSGLADVDIKAIFDASARQWGEDYVGETLDHAEIILPIFIFGNTPDEIRRKREWLKSIMPRDRTGWIICYTNTTGWRWLSTRLGSINTSTNKDPALRSGLALDVTLLVERPLAQDAPSVDSHKDYMGATKANLYLCPGAARHGWPSFVFRGPGQVIIKYLGETIRFPHVWANEDILIRTDESRPIIRSSLGRNLMPLLRGARFSHPLPKGVITKIEIIVDSPLPGWEIFGQVDREFEGLF